MNETCKWFEDEDGNWESKCGGRFSFNDGGAKDNGFSFCCYCGKPLVEQPYQENES